MLKKLYLNFNFFEKDRYEKNYKKEFDTSQQDKNKITHLYTYMHAWIHKHIKMCHFVEVLKVFLFFMVCEI